MDCFTVRDLPYPYNTDIFFKLDKLKHILDGNNWVTSITISGMRPSPQLIINSEKKE